MMGERHPKPTTRGVTSDQVYHKVANGRGRLGKREKQKKMASQKEKKRTVDAGDSFVGRKKREEGQCENNLKRLNKPMGVIKKRWVQIAPTGGWALLKNFLGHRLDRN